MSKEDDKKKDKGTAKPKKSNKAERIGAEEQAIHEAKLALLGALRKSATTGAVGYSEECTNLAQAYSLLG